MPYALRRARRGSPDVLGAGLPTPPRDRPKVSQLPQPQKHWRPVVGDCGGVGRPAPSAAKKYLCFDQEPIAEIET